MKRRDFLRTMAAGSMVGAGLWAGRGRYERPPNIVVVLVDDLGWADLSCYGSAFHESPCLDRLASEGMRFTNAYAAAPICSATRASILTGRHPARLNLTDFIPGHTRPWARLAPPCMHQRLPDDVPTLSRALQRRGYANVYLGKWHLGGQAPNKEIHGFDDFHAGGRNQFDKYASALTDKAIAFIDAHASKPFFVMLSHYNVHIPLEAQPSRVARYAAKAVPGAGQSNPVYAAMIEQLDETVGRLVGHLDASGLSENTLVVFVSDNGGQVRWYLGNGPTTTSNAPLRGEKGTLYEGGVRIPMIVRWPGSISAGTECDVPVVTTDLMPTCLDAARMGAPRDIDGLSLLPMLKGGAAPKREAIHFHYPHYHHDSPCGAMREGRYKLLERFEDEEVELYDLEADIGESRNLAGSKPQLADEMRARLAAWRESVGARLPEPNPAFDPARAAQWGEKMKPWWTDATAAGVGPALGGAPPTAARPSPRDGWSRRRWGRRFFPRVVP